MIRDCPTSELPRERLLQEGVSSLTTSELLAIIIKTGTSQENVILLSKRILHDCSLKDIATLGPKALGQMRGVGIVKAMQILAAIELGRRTFSLGSGRDRCASARDAEQIIRPALQDKTKEHFIVLLLDTRLSLLKAEVVSIGTVSSSIVHPREVFRAAIRENASSIILAHNHPSGDATPSDEDIGITKKLIMTSKVLGIPILDHIIIGIGYYSMKEHHFLFI